MIAAGMLQDEEDGTQLQEKVGRDSVTSGQGEGSGSGKIPRGSKGCAILANLT